MIIKVSSIKMWTIISVKLVHDDFCLLPPQKLKRLLELS